MANYTIYVEYAGESIYGLRKDAETLEAVNKLILKYNQLGAHVEVWDYYAAKYLYFKWAFDYEPVIDRRPKQC